MLKEFASLLWDIDPHVEAMHKRGCSGFKSSVIKLLGFNDPKTNRHKISPLNGAQIEQKVLKLESKLDRSYFESSNIKPFADVVRTTPVDAPNWHLPRKLPVLFCLSIF